MPTAQADAEDADAEGADAEDADAEGADAEDADAEGADAEDADAPRTDSGRPVHVRLDRRSSHLQDRRRWLGAARRLQGRLPHKKALT
jgi:uncharacterized protein YjbI with pentapeptide repeats